MMTDKDRMLLVKETIKKNRGLIHTKLIDVIVNKNKHMSKKTAEKIITKLLESNEIVSSTARHKKHYFLSSDDEYIGDLPSLVNSKIVILKERLDEINKKFTGYSFDAQKYIYNSMCKDLDDRINDYCKWIDEINKTHYECETDFEAYRLDLINALRSAKLDTSRCNKVRTYLERVIDTLIKLCKASEVLEEKRDKIRGLNEKEEIKEQISSIGKWIYALEGDIGNLINALKKLQPLSIRYFYGNDKIERSCTIIDDTTKESIDHIKRIRHCVDELESNSVNDDMSNQVKTLDKQTLDIQRQLKSIDTVIKKIETTAEEYRFIKNFDSKLSEVESNLNQIIIDSGVGA